MNGINSEMEGVMALWNGVDSAKKDLSQWVHPRILSDLLKWKDA